MTIRAAVSSSNGAAPRELARERRPLDELHRVPERALDVPGIVDLHDARVLERGGDARLLAEALRELGVLDVHFEQHLQGLEPLQARAPDLIHGREPAASQETEELVAAGEELLDRPAAVVDGLHAAW